MSANNQVLIKEYKGKWYVFNNVNAESWSEKNEISLKESDANFTTKEAAVAHGFKLDEANDDIYPNSEYGVRFKLAKDGADVTII